MTTWEKAFESEKNRKAFTYTVIICVALLLMFFLISWKNSPPPEPVVEDLMEINLGNNEDGFGEEQPLIKGEMSPSQEATLIPEQQTEAPEQEDDAVTPDDNAEEAAAPVVKAVKPTPRVTKPTTPAPVPPAPKPQKPKITYNGPGNGNGNNATEDNGYRSQGNTPGAKGDAGDPTGNKDSYGNTPGGKVGGPRVIRGNRKLIRSYSFTSDLKKATIYADIRVSAAGTGTFLKMVKPSTSNDRAYGNAIASYLRNMQFDKSAEESVVTMQFNFTVN